MVRASLSHGHRASYDEAMSGSTVSNWIIAIAAVANVVVYYLLWRETLRQSTATREMFLESHRPALAVSIKKCVYNALTNKTFTGQILIKNHGGSAAREVTLDLQFNTIGFARIVKLGPVSVQPQDKLMMTFDFPMELQTHILAQTDGNRLCARVDGSFRGMSGVEARYSELQRYEPALRRFTPIRSD